MTKHVKELPVGGEDAAARKIAARNLCAWAGEHRESADLQVELSSKGLRGLSVVSPDVGEKSLLGTCGPMIFRRPTSEQDREFIEGCAAPMERGVRGALCAPAQMRVC